MFSCSRRIGRIIKANCEKLQFLLCTLPVKLAYFSTLINWRFLIHFQRAAALNGGTGWGSEKNHRISRPESRRRKLMTGFFIG